MTLVNDTVSYLDLGGHICGGHWSAAINGLWNPLYAAILGVAIGLFRPSMYWEYPFVHLILFLIFLLALWCFDFLLMELVLLRQDQEQSEELSVPTWVWLTIGYTLFLWCSLRLIGVSETNPDMLVAGSFFLACGLLTRIHRGGAGWLAYLALGLVLGLGYLAKSIMFPLSLVCLLVAFVSGGHKNAAKAFGTLLLFLTISGPFIIALSLVKGRPTFGESGTYNYAVHINRIPAVHWQGQVPGSGHPAHATREIFDRPATFEFEGPLDATYPVWYDPSYWYQGVKLRFHLREQVREFINNLEGETSLLFKLHGVLVTGLFIMFCVSSRKWWIVKDLSAYWFLLVPALVALGMYAIVHWETRYLAPFLVVAILCFFLSVRLPDSPESRRVCSAVAILLIVSFISPFQPESFHLKSFVNDVVHGPKDDPDSFQEVASGMCRLGLRPGDRIASLEFSNLGMSTWARLARAKIVAEVYYWPDCPRASDTTCPDTSSNDFWKADPATQRKLIEALAIAGANFIVSHEAPPAEVSGWLRVGHSRYYVYRLMPPLAPGNVMQQ
jgi:hypothetical protein